MLDDINDALAHAGRLIKCESYYLGKDFKR